jgi:GT2 family glycosyltransferase
VSDQKDPEGPAGSYHLEARRLTESILETTRTARVHPVRLRMAAKALGTPLVSDGTSIVIASRGEGADLLGTVQSIQLSFLPDSAEIVIVENGMGDNASEYLSMAPCIVLRTETPLGVDLARATGAEIAVGKNLVFMDGHMRVSPGFVHSVERALAEAPDAVVCSACRAWGPRPEFTIYGCGFEYKAGHFDHAFKLDESATDLAEIFKPIGACYAMTRETYQHIGGFTRLFRVWGVSEDDLSVRAWLSGRRVMCDRRIITHHRHRSRFPYPVSNVDIAFNWCVMALVALEPGTAWDLFLKPCIERHGKELAACLRESFQEIIARRDEFQKRRRHPDRWLWERFASGGMPEVATLDIADIEKTLFSLPEGTP